MKFLKYTLFILFLLLSSIVQSQQLSTKGKDFWMAFMNNYGSFSGELSLYISSTTATSGNVIIPGLSINYPYTVLANSTTKVVVPITAMVNSTGVVENKGIHITALDTVSVFALNYKPATSDASIIYPTNTLDREYRILTIQGWPYHMGEEYLIVATENSTTVEITPFGGVPYIVNLNQGQVYQIINTTTALSGAFIKEYNCHKIAVFVGSVCDNIGGCAACDHLFEEMLPISRFGQNFITTPLLTKAQDYFKLVAQYNGTAVTINNGLPIILNAGQTYQFNSSTPNFVQATMPIFMLQFAQGNGCDAVGDPFSLVVPPMEQSINDITFNAFTSTIITNYYVNIVTRTAFTSTLTLDGSAVSSFAIVPGNPLYSYARVSITSGNHRIISPNKFTASVYGFGNYESYGYSAGFSLNNLQYTFTSNPNYVCPGTPIVFLVQSYPNIVTYKWLFGDGTFGYGMNVAHTYTVGANYTVGLVLTDNTSCNSDTIWKTINILPPSLDTISPSICIGDTFTVGTHHYTTTGIYNDSLIKSNGCDSILTTKLTVKPKKFTTINQTICEGNTFIVGTHSYTIAGNYKDTLQTYLGCDSIITTHLTVKPISQFTQSPKRCQGEAFSVGINSYTSTGNYTDTLTNALGCDSIIKTNLTVTPFPSVDLGKDREICEGDITELFVNNIYTSYLWQDGSTSNRFTVSQPSKYWVTVNNDNCIKSDTIQIYLCKVPINIWMPNAFTPNGDGLNDYFIVETTGEFAEYHLIIYNRWGMLIFETFNPKVGWDGKFNGDAVESGVYTYSVTFVGKDSKQKLQKNGKVTVIR
ncbi:MAG: gliding motility-associated C-terminal domain-containing protein [Bacteroidetes bacterium]|nr:gliding motility-associated C-terminal domain-containing protein [Bacteroidota bacterium]